MCKLHYSVDITKHFDMPPPSLSCNNGIASRSSSIKLQHCYVRSAGSLVFVSFKGLFMIFFSLTEIGIKSCKTDRSITCHCFTSENSFFFVPPASVAARSCTTSHGRGLSRCRSRFRFSGDEQVSTGIHAAGDSRRGP